MTDSNDQNNYRYRSLNKRAAVLERSQFFDQVGGATAVTPFVVIPADDFGHFASNYLGEVGCKNGAVRVIDDVRRNQRVCREKQDAF